MAPLCMWNLAVLGAVALVAAQPASSGGSSAQTVYVAFDGNDTNPGTREQPLLTLEAAQRAVRQLTPGQRSVTLLDGNFLRRQTLVLTEEDSHTVWQGEGKAVLDGMHDLPPEWLQPIRDPAVRARFNQSIVDRLLVCDLAKHGLTNYGRLTRHGFLQNSSLPPMELFVNGRRQTRARWPNVNATEVGMGHILNASGPHPSFSFTFDRPSSWQQPADIWLSGILSQNWIYTYNKVSFQNQTATLAYPETDPLTLFPASYCCHNRFHFDHVLEELDTEGEYYLDHDTGLLFMFLPPFQQVHSVAVSVLEQAHIELSGCTNVTLRNFALAGGWADGIGLTNATDTLLEHLEVSNVGARGIGMDPASRGSTVASTHVHHVGGQGIVLAGGSSSHLVRGEQRATNCLIHDWGSWTQVYAGGIAVWGAGNTVENCELHTTPHVGLVLGGNDHLIRLNRFHDVCLQYADMGAIYMNLGMNPFERGNRVENNFFYNLAQTLSLVNGVYPDNGSMGVSITGNIFYKLGTNGTGPTRQTGNAVMGNGYSHVQIQNNIFVDCAGVVELSQFWLAWAASKYPGYVEAWHEAFAKQNASGMLPTFLARYPALRTFWSENRKEPNTSRLTGNLVYNPTIRRVPEQQAAGFDVKSGKPSDLNPSELWLCDHDPGFADLAHMNFSLPRQAVAPHIPDWVEIPFARIGLAGPVGPAARAGRP